jgi:hypothetical protein
VEICEIGPVFQSGKRSIACFSNIIVNGKHIWQIKKRRARPWLVSKVLCAAPRYLLSNGNKGFELAGFQKLGANEKQISHFTAENLRTH